MNRTSLLTGLGAAVAADPALGGPGTATRDATPGTGDLFMALVATMLGGATAGIAPAGTGAVGPTETGADADPDDARSAEDATNAATDAAALPVAALAPLVLQAGVTPTTPTTPTPTTPTPTTGTATADPSVDATDAAPLAATATVIPGAGAASADGSGTGDERQDGNPPGQPAGSTTATTSTATSAIAERPAAHPEARVDGGGPANPAASSATVAATAPTIPPTTQAAPASDPHRVAGQVFPEVLRISDGGDGGPQRVTVKLNPESLGEVRVVLTRRSGGLEVSIAAGTDAQRALSEGAPELRRLLESVGRADSRIVIRDLPGAGPAVSAPSALPDNGGVRTDVSTDLGGDAWSGAGRPGGEPAPDREAARYATPGSSNATDGTPSATVRSRATTTDASGRPSGGLDVSI